MEFEDAALKVLTEEARPLHWTVIQDLALRRGYLDPFVQRDVRKGVVQALADLASSGLLERVDTGVYALSSSTRTE